MRINKYIAKSGIASRRKADSIILSGQIKVNNRIITDLSYTVQNDDVVLYNDIPIKPLNENYYIMLNKPMGYTCTNQDKYATHTIFELIDIDTKLFSIGRLDKDSRGLILITNDGNIYNKIIHPRSELFKTYIVKLNQKYHKDYNNFFERGIDIGGYKTMPAKIVVVDDYHIKILISEGKNRQIRRMFEVLGFKVIDLKRISIGKINLGNLKEGKYRFLDNSEVEYLKNL